MQKQIQTETKTVTQYSHGIRTKNMTNTKQLQGLYQNETKTGFLKVCVYLLIFLITQLHLIITKLCDPTYC